MNLKNVIHAVSAITIIIGIMILSSVPVGWLKNDSSETLIYLLISGIIPVSVGTVVFFITKVPKGYKLRLGVREGFGIVTFGWIVASFFGALPFVMVSDLFWYDAFFETMSGFTTTGASVLDSSLLLSNGKLLKGGLSDIPDALLFWRSLTHWLGGMGIIVLSLAILPFLGISGKSLYNAEVPGPTSDQLTPRIANSAKILWGVYVLLSIAETAFLYLGGMDLLDAWCHTCGTMATGGFSTKQASIGYFNSVYFDLVIIFFMFCAGANFILHFKALRGKALNYFYNEEFKFYLMVVLMSVAVVSFAVYGTDIRDTFGREYNDAGYLTSLRFSAFQVVSLITTTGFCTADFNIWPAFACMLLVFLMFVGGCGGSTGGGMKHSRILLLLKYSAMQIKKCLFPRAILSVRLNDRRIDEVTIYKVLSFFFLFIFLFMIFGFFTAVLCRTDLITAFTASAATLCNIGPGLGKVGATSTYSWMPASAKMLLTMAMLIGRLEVYTVLVLILPSFWKK